MRWGLRGALAVLACLVTVIVALQLAFGDISAVGNLLIPAQHQGLILKLAIDLQWTPTTPVSLSLGAFLSLPGFETANSFRVQDPGWGLCS